MGSRMMIDGLAVMATRELMIRDATARNTPRKAAGSMFPFPYLRDLEAPQPVPRKMLDDLGLTQEEIAQLGPLLDAPPLNARVPVVAVARRIVGGGLVRLGQFIQDRCDPEVNRPACEPLGTAE